ncbi:MAG: transcriptional activator NhaR [Alphaproteobacteria bacterium]|nr:transcriptional activator NhaR [Rhodospirillales bacterium]MCW9045341.1 transcriptional activator NhaR [Alphaproteobacteria bacterium]
MANINFKHLKYFWAVAKEGSVTQASEFLNVTPQTISGQLKLLEGDLGVKLFKKTGRNLILTEAGHKALGYCEKVFQLEAELETALLGPKGDLGSLFRVGIVDAIPKLIAYQMIEPVFQLDNPVRLVCREGDIDTLLADLAVHKLDLVLTECPVPPTLRLDLFSHPLGECGTVFFGTKDLVDRFQENFPKSLTGAPILMQSKESSLHSDLRRWFNTHHIFPSIKAEIEDSALLKVFGEKGFGIFTAPAIIEDEVAQQYDVMPVGRAEDLRVQFYAISAERERQHPGVTAITDHFRSLFSRDGELT